MITVMGIFSLIADWLARPELRPRLNWLLGLGLTMIVLLLMGSGAMGGLERSTLDWRFRNFAYYNPYPSDRIVHIDIDDQSLARTERWPWPRERVAQVVDELSRLGARVIAFDVLFTEPQSPRLLEVPPSSIDDADTTEPPAGREGPSLIPWARRVQDDQVLAESIGRAGNVYMPIRLTIGEPDDALTLRVLRLLREDMTLDADAVAQRLKLDPEMAREARDTLERLRGNVARAKLFALLDQGRPLTEAECRTALLPDLPEFVQEAPVLTALHTEYERVRAVLELSRDAPLITDAQQFLPEGRQPDVPIRRFAERLAGTGSVTYKADPDSRVRSVPLWIRHEGRRYPHLMLRVACAYLDVPIDQVRIADDQTVLPDARMPNGDRRDIRIPMLPVRPDAGGGGLTGRAMVSWPTNAKHWADLYDPYRAQSKQHFPIGPLIEIHKVRQDMADNEASLNQLVLDAAGKYMSAAVLRYEQVLAALSDPSASAAQRGQAIDDRDLLRQAVIQQVSDLAEHGATMENLTAEESAYVEELRMVLDGYEDLALQDERARQKISDFDQRVGKLVRDTICLVGWTSTASLADFVTTSLDERCPGVVVQGAVLHSILTDHFIRRGPLWLDMALALFVGLLVTFISTRFSPVGALVITAVFVWVSAAINGLLLFDYMNVWVTIAGPSTVATVVWAGLTVFRLIAEQQEKARITRRFKNYVSPDLVDYLIQNPNVVNLEGQRRELTCMFSDIASFTSISEKLGPEQTVKLLNHYLSTMTERLMLSRAYVNKYLGDGIMAFWGAPIGNEKHALDACASVLECIDALNALNQNPQFEGLPPLFMRVGLCTGPMMVGDCGAPPQRSDYTVIGDSVNLSSRLEGANKQFGTQILISNETRAQVEDEMLTRMVGRLVVVGRQEAESVHELLAPRDQATGGQGEMAERTTEAVTSFIEGNFERCREQFTELSGRFGTSKLAEVYLDSCRQLIDEPVDDFDGTLVLTEK